MPSLNLDLFVEDYAHEAFLTPLLKRIAAEEGVDIALRVRTAKGGHGKALAEYRLYQRIVKRRGGSLPDLVIVAIDSNCASFAETRKAIDAATLPLFAGKTIAACPEPHIERWFFVDLDAFYRVVGHRPSISARKCMRDYYKQQLRAAVRSGGHPVILGGIEFAPDIVAHIDWYRAEKNDRSFKSFRDDVLAAVRRWMQP